MSQRKWWRQVLSPPAAVDARDTGLVFTDILFGFVIYELFRRLQHVGALQGFVRWQLVVGATLVLGSWIGFRRSLNRSVFQPKFVNLPLIRFVLDQLMVILYFKIAVLYPNQPNAPVDPSALVHQTCHTLFAIFLLYLLWDLAGIRMAYVHDGTLPKYPEIHKKTNETTENPAPVNWIGFAITFGFLVAFGVLYFVTRTRTFGPHGAEVAFGIAALLLLGYRWAKEIRTSFSPPRGPEAPVAA